MKLIAIAALMAGTEAMTHGYTNQEKLYSLMQLQGNDCPDPLPMTEDEMHSQLGEFSRTF
mgnify:CR=1 FL=1|jgi:hypothetical protein